MPEQAPEDRARTIDTITTEVDRVRDMVDRQLQLSALETRKGLQELEETDLAGVVNEVSESLMPLITAKNIALSHDARRRVKLQPASFTP